MPPGRRSTSTSGVVHGAGVNHFIKHLGLGPGREHELERDSDDAFEHEVELGVRHGRGGMGWVTVMAGPLQGR